MCLLVAVSVVGISNSVGQSTQQPGSTAPAAAPAKPAKLDNREERSDRDRSDRERSEREKREELGKKLERRRVELNSVPSNNLMPSNGRAVKSEDATRNSSDSKSKEKK